MHGRFWLCVAVACAAAQPAAAAPRLANRCFAVGPVMGKVFLKPTGLGTYLLHAEGVDEQGNRGPVDGWESRSRWSQA